MPTPGKLGKLTAVRPHALSDLTTYAAGKLPAPPASVAYPVLEWGMDGNDQCGDCTMAGAAHLIAAWNAEVEENADPAPTSTQVVTEYFDLTNGQDSGLVEHTVLATWHRRGLWGNRIAGYAPVDPGDLTALHQAIAFYGGAYLGVQLPDSAQQQFAAGEPWTVVPGSPVEGGHCIVAAGYSPQGLYCVTWGQVVEVTYPWAAKYLDEAWCVLSEEYVQHGGGPAIDLAALRADLAAI